jgi:hypothetical protein
MNILTAPLKLLFPPISMGLAPGASAFGRSMVEAYFRIATLLTFIMLGFGIYLLIAGTPGDLEIAGKELSIKTKTAGLALTVLGLLFYLVIGKLIMDREKRT